jgi:AAA domain
VIKQRRPKSRETRDSRRCARKAHDRSSRVKNRLPTQSSRFLHDVGGSKDEKGRGAIGLCTPYTAQAKLLREILKSHGLEKDVRASTAHGFQGDERTVLVLDLVDSIGERNAGLFLQSNHLGDSGAKLQNVAISRAKEAIIVVANLTFLDAKLPGDAKLRGLLHDLQQAGRLVDVREVLALRPIYEDLKRFDPQPKIDPEALRTGFSLGATSRNLHARTLNMPRSQSSFLRASSRLTVLRRWETCCARKSLKACAFAA